MYAICFLIAVVVTALEELKAPLKNKAKSGHDEIYENEKYRNVVEQHVHFSDHLTNYEGRRISPFVTIF